jgi:hypothetical protein
MNKHALPDLEKKFASLDKKAKIKYIEETFDVAWERFLRKPLN